MALATPKEQAATDLAALFSTDLPWVETVTYTPNGGAVLPSFPAIVDYGEAPNRGNKSRADQATITVRKSDVANPGYRDTVLIGSDTWHVKGKAKSDSLVWVLNITNDERPGYGH